MPTIKTVLTIAVLVMLVGSVSVGGPGVAPGETHEHPYMKQYEMTDNENTDP